MRALAFFMLFFLSGQLYAVTTVTTNFVSVGVDFDDDMAIVTLGLSGDPSTYSYATECSDPENGHRVIISFPLEDFLSGWQAVYATALAALAQGVTAAVTMGECLEGPQGIFTRRFQGILITSEASY